MKLRLQATVTNKIRKVKKIFKIPNEVVQTKTVFELQKIQLYKVLKQVQQLKEEIIYNERMLSFKIFGIRITAQLIKSIVLTAVSFGGA